MLGRLAVDRRRQEGGAAAGFGHPATVIIAGIAEGMMSTWIPLVVIVVAILGAFGFAEILSVMKQPAYETVRDTGSRVIPRIRDVVRRWWTILRSGVLGYTAYTCPRPAGPELDTDMCAVMIEGLSLGDARRRAQT